MQESVAAIRFLVKVMLIRKGGCDWVCAFIERAPTPPCPRKLDNETRSELREAGPGCDKERTNAQAKILGAKSGDQKTRSMNVIA
jgi:hypothetical protein